MNNTARLHNRISLTVIGLLLTGVGAGCCMVLLSPASAEMWQSLHKQLGTWLQGTPRLGDYMLTLTWGQLTLIGVLLITAVWVLITLLAQGGGKRSTVHTQPAAPQAINGKTSYSVKLIEDLVSQAHAHDTEILALHVSCFAASKTNTVRVRVQMRRGVNPTAVAQRINITLDSIAALLDTPLPRVIELKHSLRTSFSAGIGRVV